MPSLSLMGQADKILSPESIIKLIPDKVDGYYLDESSKSKVIKLGNMQYSTAYKNIIV
jgi:hypothetical protein